MISLDLYRLKNIAFQNPNLWDFYIVGAPAVMKFLVTDTSLPFEKLETETRNTGSKHYTGYTPVEEFTITFRETTNFDVQDYLQEWKDSIYDSKKKVFKTGPGLDRTAVLAFQKPVYLMNVYSKIFSFTGLKLKGMEPKSLNYTAQDSLMTSATFVADEINETTVVPFVAHGSAQAFIDQQLAASFQGNVPW